MSALKELGGDLWAAEAIDFRSPDPRAILKLGITKKAIATRASRGQSWSLGQLYGIIEPGLIMADHLFQGLRRPMSVNGNSRADETKLVFTWAARRDAQMTRDGELNYVAAPVNAVFFVIASPNGDTSSFPGIFGWIENWGWLQAHPDLPGAPVQYDSRYDSRLWSRR